MDSRRYSPINELLPATCLQHAPLCLLGVDTNTFCPFDLKGIPLKHFLCNDLPPLTYQIPFCDLKGLPAYTR